MCKPEFRMILMLVFIVPLFGISRSSEEIRIVYENEDVIELQISFPDFQLKTIEIDGTIYRYVFSSGLAYPLQAGSPLLPYCVKSIIIPENKEIDTEILSEESKEINIGPVLSRSSDPGQIVPGPRNLVFGEMYKSNNWFPEQIAEVGDPYVFRDYRGVALYLHPFRYNHITGKLKVITRLNVRMYFSGTSAKSATAKKILKTPRAFNNLYKRHFINYPPSSAKYTMLGDEGDMIVITTESYYSSIIPFVKWKISKGIRTTVYMYPDQTGTAPADIKQFIQQIYDSTGSLAYILIAGDAEDVPPGIGYAGSGGFDSDPVYTLLAGDDEYPDAFIGRFSAENGSEMTTIVQKNLNYEMTPDPAGEWYHKAAGIASDDEFPPLGVDTAVMNGIRDTMLAYHYTHFDKIYDPGATAGDLVSALNSGRSWINYLGHGSPTGWSTTGFTVNHISQLQNVNMNPVVISVACNTGTFSGVTGLAESWQRAGTPEAPKGSVAFLGSTITHYNSATIGKLEMIHHLVNENFFTMGGIMVNGIMESIDYYPGIGVSSGAECFQGWHLFGDPSVMVYSDTPGTMTLDYNSSIHPGDTAVTVVVSDENGPVGKALIAFSDNGQLLGSSYSDETGTALVHFSEPVGNIADLQVVTTGYNKLPLFDTVSVNIISMVSESVSGDLFYLNPNPAANNVKILFTGQAGHLSIHSLNGKIEFETEVGQLKNPFNLQINDFDPGIYLVSLRSKNSVQYRKFVIAR